MIPPLPISGAQTIDRFESMRLIATRLRADHLADYRRLFQNERVMQMLTPDGLPLSDDEAARWIQFSLEHWERHRFGYWIWHARENGQFVGRAGLKRVVLNDQDKVEVGYALLPEYWGQGLATEMAETILKLCFGPLDLLELMSYALAKNRASRRVMEKAGFLFEREADVAGISHVFYRLTKAHWQDHFDPGERA